MKLTGRGVGVIGGALALWLGSRLLGGPDLHVVAVGLLALPGLSALFLGRRRVTVTARRRLSATRVFPGARVRVELEVRDQGPRGVLLLDDRLPPTLGGSARAVLTGSGERRIVAYEITARARGRYRVGPLTAYRSDPFDLIRRQIEVPGTQELVVFPEVEELRAGRTSATGAGSGDSASRRVLRSGDEFYTIRAYEIGEDLRRIHWPSTARTGRLMIRQDEAARRSAATIVLDSREASLGGHKAVFERAVSAAASAGVHLIRSGFALRLATPDMAPRPVTRAELLETLAGITSTRTVSLVPSLNALSGRARAGVDVVVVTHLPLPEELAALSRVRSGRRIAILLPPEDPDRLGRQGRAELSVRVRAAQAALEPAGWDVMMLAPSGRLRNVWQLRRSSVRTATPS